MSGSHGKNLGRRARVCVEMVGGSTASININFTKSEPNIKLLEKYKQVDYEEIRKSFAIFSRECDSARLRHV